MMNINMQDLTWLISHAVDAGVQEYMKGVDPSLDKVKKSQAERFLESRGYKKDALQVDRGGAAAPGEVGRDAELCAVFLLGRDKEGYVHREGERDLQQLNT